VSSTIRNLLIALLACLAGVGSARAGGASGMPVSPAAPLLSPAGGADPCVPHPLSAPLTLGDAVSRALCANPKTRAAWVNIALYAAEVHTAEQSYLPSLGASGTEQHSVTETKLNDEPALNTDSSADYPQGRISLSWLVFDFGKRSNEWASARELLAASRANLDLTLQQVFLRAAADYYDAQSARASLDAAIEIEQLSQRSFEAARARVQRGVAPISDQLQAQTAHAEAVLARVKAYAALASARGALALDMGLDPDSPLGIPPAQLQVNAPPGFDHSLHALIEEAKRDQPSIAVAESELAAAKADERIAIARGWPTVSLVGGLGRSNEPLTPSLGSPSIPGSVSDRSIGLEIDVPISDLLWKRGAIEQAQARVAIERQALEGARQQAAAEVWNSYTALRADTDNLANSQTLLESAQSSLVVSQHRYEGGAGNILELLSAQSAYANARQERIQSLSDWRIARLALAASLGRLGMWTLQGGH
jgi:outer membrane protein